MRAALLILAFAYPPLRAADYSHLHPKHVGIECSACHTLEPNQVDIHTMPAHVACSSCHNFADETVKRAEPFCGECHTSLTATKDQPALYYFPKQHSTHDFGDQFSHVAHKKAGRATDQSTCTDCHAPVLAEQQPDMHMEGSHTFCFTCHGENPRGYSAERKSVNPSRNDCAVCHVGGEATLASFANIKDFRHADHVCDTRPRLKSAGPPSHDPDVLCVECHKTAAEAKQLGDIRPTPAATCSLCHTGQVGLPDVLKEQRP